MSDLSSATPPRHLHRCAPSPHACAVEPPLPFPSLHNTPCHCHCPARYAYDWGRIRQELLPTKTEQQLFHRKKNRVAGNAPDNCVKVSAACAMVQLRLSRPRC